LLSFWNIPTGSTENHRSFGSACQSMTGGKTGNNLGRTGANYMITFTLFVTDILVEKVRIGGVV
jgi:hypothetical protein